MEKGPSWEANSRSGGKKCPPFMETEGSLPCSERADHWSLSLSRWKKSTPYNPVLLTAIMVLFPFTSMFL